MLNEVSLEKKNLKILKIKQGTEEGKLQIRNKTINTSYH